VSAPTFDQYLAWRGRFAVSRGLAVRALGWAQPPAREALGIHTQRQTLVEGELPAYVVLTTPQTNGGWGELMPVWFKPYERPVPLYCLDNWALFALLYRSAFGPEGNASTFIVDDLTRVVIGADLLIPFLPGTDGAGRFLRHGALPLLLGILWLEPGVRDAWLALHRGGARAFAAEHSAPGLENVGEWLEHVENEALLVPERGIVAGEAAVRAFLEDEARVQPYRALFGGLCLSVSALAAAFGVDWRTWVFQAINVRYRLPGFGLAEIAAWLAQV
jgi:hypothetical protein